MTRIGAVCISKVVLGSLVALVCSALVPSQLAWSSEGEYAVQPGDILQVSVWKEEALQLEVLVRPDGGISFPLAGDLLAEGKTVKVLQDELAALLTRFIPDPVVTVAVSQILGNKIYVLGKVNKPGEFVVTRHIDVIQALSMAGGLTTFADLNDIKVIRRGASSQQVFGVDYSQIERGLGLEKNIMLRSGDVVIVP